MRGLTRRWIFRRPQTSGEPSNAPLLERVLGARGIDDAEGIQRFCEPKLTDLHDPDLLDTAVLARTRHHRAAEWVDRDGLGRTVLSVVGVYSVSKGGRLERSRGLEGR